MVTGPGRLQFHSAPNLRCPMDGMFVIGKDVGIGEQKVSADRGLFVPVYARSERTSKSAA